MFEQVRRAVDSLESVARELEPRCLDGRDAAALVELAARGERICASIKPLAARRVDETKVWRDEGAPQRRTRSSRCSHIQELS